MQKLLKYHYYYLINKPTLITICIVLGIISVDHLMLLQDTSKYALDEVVNAYLAASSSLTQILFVFLSIFIFSIYTLASNDYYVYLLYSVSRKKFIFSKIILYFIFLGLVITSLFCSFLINGIIYIKGFYFQNKFLVLYLQIYVLGLIYGLYGMIMMMAFNNIMTNFVLFSIFIFSNNLSHNTIIGKIFIFFFPNLNNLGNIYGIWLIAFLFLLVLLIYEKKNLNNI